MPRIGRQLVQCLVWLTLYITVHQVSSEGDDSKKLPVEHRTGFDGPPVGSLAPLQPPSPPIPIGLMPRPGGSNDLWPESRSDMPQIKNLNVLCEKNFMKVSIEFDRPFYGMIFSKGHYSDIDCVHIKPGNGFLTANFDVFLNNCGTASSAGDMSTYGGPAIPGNAFIENTIIIQYDPLVQEVWDQARKLRCTWYDYYEKTVTFKPFNVDAVQAVQANFLGDNIQCWMQIQVGKGPWANEVSGIVKIGQTMTMVLAIKDEENKFDMLVRDCVAHDGKRPPIQLVDEFGCVVRSKVMSPFQKIRNFGASASVVSYAYFQAFKFPDSMNVFFQCVIQVCRHQCPEPVCGPEGLDFVDPRVAALAKRREDVAAAVASAPAPAAGRPRDDGKPPPKPQVLLQQPPPPSSKQPIRVPFPLAINPGYMSVGRDGVANVSGSYSTPNGINGRPRAADLNKQMDNETVRRRRRTVAEDEKDDDDDEKMTIPTSSRVIQVVAPGDVAFNLNTGNETVVFASKSKYDLERSSICMTTPSFVAGLSILLLIMCVACIVAAFMFLRMRSFNRKCGTDDTCPAEFCDNPEFTK